MLNKTTKEAYLIAVTMPISHNHYSTITEKLQKCVGLKEELTRIWHLNTVYIVQSVLSTMGIIPNKLHDSLKLLSLHPGLMQKAVILNTQHMPYSLKVLK
jgi:hypothetical protein